MLVRKDFVNLVGRDEIIGHIAFYVLVSVEEADVVRSPEILFKPLVEVRLRIDRVYDDACRAELVLAAGHCRNDSRDSQYHIFKYSFHNGSMLSFR